MFARTENIVRTPEIILVPPEHRRISGIASLRSFIYENLKKAESSIVGESAGLRVKRV